MFLSYEALLCYGPKISETSGTFQVFGLFLAWWIVLAHYKVTVNVHLSTCDVNGLSGLTSFPQLKVIS